MATTTTATSTATTMRSATANAVRSATANAVRAAANAVRSAEMRTAANAVTERAMANATAVRSEVTTVVAMTESTALLSKVTTRVTEATAEAEMTGRPNHRLLMLSLHDRTSSGRHLVSILSIEGAKFTLSCGSKSAHHEPDSSSLSHSWYEEAGSSFLNCDCLSDTTHILLPKLGQTALQEHIELRGLQPVLSMPGFELDSNAVSRAVVSHESLVVVHHMELTSGLVDLTLVLRSSEGVDDGLLLNLSSAFTVTISDEYNRA